MGTKDYLEVLMLVCSIAAVVVVGRDNIKKQTISDLQALVLAHEQTINVMKEREKKKDERISALEETVDGYAELVRQGYLIGFRGPPGGNGPTSP